MEKEMDDKLYKVIRKKGNHISKVVNADGSRTAIQFDNVTNCLNGPVELIEVDEKELIEIQKNNRVSNLVIYVIDNILAPFFAKELEKGVDRLWDMFEKKIMPKAVCKVKRLSKKTRLYTSAFRDVMFGVEPKVMQLIKEAEENKYDSGKVLLPNEIKQQEKYTEQKEFKSSSEVQYLLEVMRANVIVLASCIRILTDIIVKDNGKKPETVLKMKTEIEKLSSKEMMRQINLLLEDKNRSLLDETTLKIISAFRDGNFVVGEELIPINKFCLLENNYESSSLNAEQM